MSDLDKAREWAKRRVSSNYYNAEQTQAAVDVIQSLPDQWVDAEKVKAIIADMDHCLKMKSTTDFSKGIDNATTSWRDALKALITPKLPTLAELTKQGNDPEQYRWMQAKVFHTEELGCVTKFDLYSECATALFPNGVMKNVPWEEVTPLPDLPKLKWPGGGDTPTISNKEKVAGDQAVAKDVCNSEPNSSETPKSSIKPDDVIPNQPWLVEINGEKYVGTRFSGVGIFHPWAVAALDGAETFSCDDMAITLIHKLVPEPPALPEGMRLADHAEYGRVVVSPGINTFSQYLVFRLDGTIYRATDTAVHKEHLNFLDGEPNA